MSEVVDVPTNVTATSARFDLVSFLVSFLSNQKRNIAVVALLAGGVAAFIVIALWANSSGSKPLFADPDNYDSSAVISALEAANIPFDMDVKTGAIYVADGEVSATRMLLATKGVLPKKPIGLDILQSEGGLGTSQFIENARYKLGLEGELSATVRGLDAVANARVHLAIPEQTLFVRQTGDKPSASVLIELKNAQILESSQVEAIMRLISSSVAGMPLENVAVSDQFGNLLSSEVGSDVTGALDDKYLEYQFQLERTLSDKVKSILSSIMGPNGFKVQSSTQVNFDIRREESHLPDGPTHIVSQSIIESSGGNQNAIGIPGSLSNAPPEPTQVTAQSELEPEADNQVATDGSRQSKSTYTIGEKRVTTQYRQGRIEKMSVAVILDDKKSADPSLGWTAAEILKIRNIVASSIGLDEARGDELSIENFPFSDPVVIPAVVIEWYEQPKVMEWAKLALGGLLALVVFFTVIRPMVKQVTLVPMQPQAIEHDKSDRSISATEDGMNTRQPPTHPTASNKMAELNLATGQLPPSGSPVEVQVQHLQKLATEDSERVSDVLKSWVKSNG